MDIVRCLMRGLRNKEIALELGLSIRTVKNNLAVIMDKWQVTDRLNVVLRAQDLERVGALDAVNRNHHHDAYWRKPYCNVTT